MPLGEVNRDRVIAAAALKRFERWIKDYRGPPSKLREHLLGKIAELNSDGFIAGIFDEILGS